ncbi:MAG TPA: lamin tail domain-containing protein, partial [Lapillicoccus sp.]|nr:lamin tail domain-containing protein [Lapillicoccus sp.]
MPLSSLSSPARRLVALALLPLVGTAALVAAAPTAQAVDASSPIVISEVYGGGGNSGATYTNDFIELYNKGNTDIDLSAWSVQYASATGATYARTNLSGIVAANSYYLIQEAAGAGGTTPLPAPGATGNIAMSGTAGKVALVKNQTNLACGTDCDSATIVADFVGYGATANDYAGSGPAPAPSNTTSDQR